MKTATIVTLAALATSAFALPEPWGKDDKHWGKEDKHWGKVDKHWGKDKGRGKWGKDKHDKGPIPFTSTYKVIATPDQVVNATEDGDFVYTGGLPGAIGYYNFGINSEKNMICYDITLEGFRGKYESAANTATHIHEAPKGEAGPPRLAFPNPVKTGKKNVRVSTGCLTGPFTTGIEDEETGADTGAGFHVSQIEEDPAAFFCDVHSSLAVPGAVRGQLG